MTSNDEQLDHLWDRRNATLQRIEISVLYHHKRERFFECLDKGSKAIAVIGGSSAFAGFGGDEKVRIAAAIIAVTSTIALVVGFSDKSRRHSQLARAMRELQADIAGKGDRDFAEADLNAWDERMHRIEAGEPPALGTLVTLCQNELAIAAGHPESVVPVSIWRRVLAPFFDIPTQAHRA